VAGTDEELTLKMGQFNQHIERQRQALLQEERGKQDIEDEILTLRDQHTDLLSLKGKLSAEADAQKARLTERETLLRDAAKQYNIPVPEQKLERDAVAEVVSRLQDAQRRQKSEFERIQVRTRNRP
jgi:DNA repair protein RAD50